MPPSILTNTAIKLTHSKPQIRTNNNKIIQTIMATNYMSLNSEKQEPKKTVFEKHVDGCLAIDATLWRPDEFKNVLHIGKDNNYGDVFKAWNDDENDFFIFFGTAGDEFKK